MSETPARRTSQQPMALSTTKDASTTKAPAAREGSEQQQRRSEAESEAREWSWLGAPGVKLAQGLIFGIIFGFLLQKGGVAKFDILIGVLLLENFVVVQVMLSAVIVGMIGVYLLHRAGVMEYQIKTMSFGANILGGLIFGVGFALLAYCPGTNAAALGQGNLDALVGVVGLALGSYLFGLSSSSKLIGGKVPAWGNRGKLTLPEMVGLSRGMFVAIAAPVLVGVLVLIELFLAD